MAGRIAEVAKVKDVQFVAAFKAFVMKGNVMDLAVGIIIGVAFGTVVTSLVNDVMMPPIGLAIGGVDFKESYIMLEEGTPPGPYPSLEAATQAGAVTLRWGAFVNTVINFLIVAFAVFLMVQAVAKMKAREAAKKAAAPPTEEPCPHCRMKIPVGAARCGFCTSSLQPARA